MPTEVKERILPQEESQTTDELLNILDYQMQNIDYLLSWREQGADFYDDWEADLIEAVSTSFKIIKAVQNRIKSNLIKSSLR